MIIENLIKRFGYSGFPLGMKKELKATWEAYDNRQNETNARERICAILGFLHLMTSSKVAALEDKLNPYIVYKDILQEDFKKYVKTLAEQFRKIRIFDLFKVDRIKILQENPVRSSYNVTINIAVSPRSKESLDHVLHKAEGFLYKGRLPTALSQKWKKIPINSKRAPTSTLPKVSESITSVTSYGCLPIFTNDNLTLYVMRCREESLVFKFVVNIPVDNIPWISNITRRKMVEDLIKQSLKTL